MDTSIQDRIQSSSKIPKYQQLVNSIVRQIESGQLKQGDRLPSIIESSLDYNLSRDTVERGYKLLHQKGMITSVYRRGYFVDGLTVNPKMKIFFLLGEITERNRAIYRAFTKSFGKKALVDMFLYHYKKDIFQQLLEENLGRYHYYLIAPHLLEYADDILKTIKKVPDDKLIIIDKDIDWLTSTCGTVCKNFENDTLQCLEQIRARLARYKKLHLVIPEDEFCHPGIISGFKIFCQENGWPYTIMDGLEDEEPVRDEAYFIINDKDLAVFIKKIREKNIKIGKETGVVSFDDNGFKEILEQGITVITSDSEKIGETAASIITHDTKQKVVFKSKVIVRNSL